MAPALKNPPPLAKAKAKAIPKDLVLQLPPPQSPVTAAAAAAPAIPPLVEPLVPPPTTTSANAPAPFSPSPSPSTTGNLTVLPQLLLANRPTPVKGLPKSTTPSTPSTSHAPTTAGNHVKQTAASSGSQSKAAAKKDRPGADMDNQGRLQIQNYLCTVSGQVKVPSIQEMEHDYARPPPNHPDAKNRAKSTIYLFMKNFPRHVYKQSNYAYANCKDDEMVDVVTVEEPKKIPFLTPRPPSTPMVVDEDTPELDSSITDSWTCDMNKLWTKANKILLADRVERLTCEGSVNEVLQKRNLQEWTANKFKELFASMLWDQKLVMWLHSTLLEHLDYNYKPVYLDSLQILKHKIPDLINWFYHEPKATENKAYKPYLNDPLFNTLSHFKPKKLPRKPIFIIIPNGPPSSHQSGRLKYWHSMFSSMGKVVTIPVNVKNYDHLPDVVNETRAAVNEKIRNSRSTFASRPLILVGFYYGSITAAFCALNNRHAVCALVCLGFPLKSPIGNRGELDDPLLELTVPTQFIIGENSIMTPIDDMEDFRERLKDADTSQIVVGGADDKLVVSNLKKRFECLTQSMVDRCVAEGINTFLSSVLSNYSEDIAQLNPNHHSNLIPANHHPNHLPHLGTGNASTSTPKQPKKKQSKKRPTLSFADGNGSSPIVSVIPNGLPNGNMTPLQKPPVKRKRPSTSASSSSSVTSKPKSPRSGRISPLIIPLHNFSPAFYGQPVTFGRPPPPAPTTVSSSMNGNLAPGLLPSDSPALHKLASKIIFQQNQNNNTGKPVEQLPEKPPLATGNSNNTTTTTNIHNTTPNTITNTTTTPTLPILTPNINNNNNT